MIKSYCTNEHLCGHSLGSKKLEWMVWRLQQSKWKKRLSRCCPESFMFSITSKPVVAHFCYGSLSTTWRELHSENTICSSNWIVKTHETENPSYPIFGQKNPAFAELITVLDNPNQVIKIIRCIGVKSCTEAISSDEEDQLWERILLMLTHAPLGLLRCVFFYNGKCSCLRGGQEHRVVKLLHVERCQNPRRYKYNKNASKNHKGGLSESLLEHKSVPTFTNPSASSKCHVLLLELYIRKLPKEAFE